MSKEFTLDIVEKEAQFLNGLLPRNHSVQVFQKYERRRKAEKKLDDMYVAQFSLRPVKKIKKQSDIGHSRLQKNNQHESKQNNQENFERTNIHNSRHQALHSGQNLVSTEAKKLVEQAQAQRNAEIQTQQMRQSRSSRVSKPTDAYLQFQDETFKRKIVQKPQSQANSILPQRHNDPTSYSKEPVRSIRQIEGKKQPGNKIKSFNEKKQIQKQASKQSHVEKNHKPRKQSIKGEPSQVQNVWKSFAVVVEEAQKELVKLKTLPQIIQVPKTLSVQKQEKISSPKQELATKNCQINFPQTKNTPISKPIQSQQPSLTRYYRILQRLKAHKSSWPFRHPVDPVGQGVPDYLSIISHPMDLKTIEKKLRSQKYSSQQQFYSDINLMLSNSYKYNPRQSKYYKLTIQIENVFNELKGKQQIPKLMGRGHGVQQDDQNSDYNEISLKDDKRQISEDGISDQENCNKNNDSIKSQSSSRKRSLANSSKIQVGVESTGKSGVKVLITDDGMIRKKKAQTGNLVQKVCQTSHFREDNDDSAKKPVIQQKSPSTIGNDIRHISGSSKKQQKQAKQSEKKKPIQDSSKNQQQKKIQDQNLANTLKDPFKQLNFGYFEPKILIIQRQALHYDILQLKSLQSQLRIHELIQNNQQVFKKCKYPRKRQTTQSSQFNEPQQDSQGQSYDIQLKNLTPEAYKIMRRQVTRLLRAQQKQESEKCQATKKNIIQGIQKVQVFQ